MAQTLISNFRFDPFLGTLLPNTIVAEPHIISKDAPFWVTLDEIPYQQTPSNIRIAGYIETVGYPGPKEFRVDYRYGTGAVQFHAADKNTRISVSYLGLGSPLSADYLDRLALRHPRNSFYSGVAKFDDIGDHFPAPSVISTALVSERVAISDGGSTSWLAAITSIQLTDLNPTWFWRSSPQVKDTYTGRHELQLQSDMAGYGLIVSRANFRPAANILMRTRIKAKPRAVFTWAVTLGMFIGFGSLTTPGGINSIYPLFGITNRYNDTSNLQIVWPSSPGGAHVNTLVLPMPTGFFNNTAWAEVTLIYTYGLLLGCVNGSVVVHASTLIPSLPGRFMMGTTSGDYAHDLYADYVEVRQLISMDMS